MWCDFFIQLLSNVFGGIILALIFFYLSDHLFKIPSLSGYWLVEVTTEQTVYNPFQGMVITFKVFVWLEGKNIYGTGEKIKDKVGNLVTEYSGIERTQIKISGSVIKKYLGKDKVVIHIEEKGKLRDSSTIYLLHKNKESLLEGKFYSTIADSDGKVKWVRQSELF